MGDTYYNCFLFLGGGKIIKNFKEKIIAGRPLMLINMILFFVFLLLATSSLKAQTNGDYRTRAEGNWNNNATWQVYNGTWTNCATGDYPGASTPAGAVNINHVITLPTNISATVNSVYIDNGNKLTVYGKLTINTNLSMHTNGDFTLGDGAVVIVQGNFTGGNNTELSISSYLIVYGNMSIQNGGQSALTITDAHIYVLGSVSSSNKNFTSCNNYDGTTSTSSETCDAGTFEALTNNTSNPDPIIADIIQQAIADKTENINNLSPLASCICPGGSTNLTINETRTVELLKWYRGTTLTSNLTNPSKPYNYVADQAGTYNALYKIGSTWHQTNSVTITSKQTPTASLLGSTTICYGNSTPITINLGGDGPWNFTYSDGTTPVTVTDQTTSPYIVNVSPTTTKTYSLTHVSNGCCNGTTSGSAIIIVTPSNTVSPPSSTPTLCINTALTDITHTTTGATGIGTSTGLPAGVTAVWNSNTITISGTPTEAGTFNYSIPLTGGCGTLNATGTITVNQANTVSGASSTPTLCINTALMPITHTTTGATGIGTPTGLPAGVTPGWSGGTITISGTPSASGTFNYSIPLTGGCGSVNATGTIIVNPDNTVSGASSTPTLCINTALTNITHSSTNATGIGTPNGLPAGVTAGGSGETITISGTPTESGTFNYSIPLLGGCGSVNATRTITVTPFPNAAGEISGAAAVTAGQTAISYSVPVIPNANSYTWLYSGTGATISGTTNSITVDYAINATSGNLTVTGMNNCGSGIASTNFPIAVSPPSPCDYTANTASSVTDYYPCINTSLTTWVNTVSNSIAPRQYFVMNVIKGLTYSIYTCESGMNSPLQMTIYEEGQSTNPPLAFSYSNTGNPCLADNFNVFTSYTATFTGKIRVLINQIGNCAATTPANIDVRVRVTGGSNTQDSPTVAGTNSWIGHFYDGAITTLRNTLFNQEFTGYLGYYTENETFDRDYGGSGTNNCFSSIYSGGSLKASLNTDTYAIRYRMNSTKRGLYTVTLGSDDGSRLAIDGQLVYNNWSDHGYTSANQALISLSGNSNLVYDFYENGVDNRVTFNNLTLIFENTLSVNTTQTICLGGDGSPISGDQFNTLPGGISLSGTGYQWTYSTTPGGTRTTIAGATGATFSPSTQTAPFNQTGTYYIYRNAILSSVNNLNPNPYTATNESNSAMIIVEESAITSTTSGSRCGSGTVTLQATTSSGSVDWYALPTGGTVLWSGNSFTTPVLNSTTVYYAHPTSGGCLSNRIPVYAYIQSNPDPPGSISGATNVYQNTTQTYSVVNVPGTAYNWSFPSGWVQTGGSTTNSVTVTVGSGSGNISVTPSNACGTGTTQSLPVTVYSLGISVAKTDLCTSGGSTGSITATGIGGQTPYQYKLNSGNYQASGNFTAIAAGTYTVWVKDNGGVEASTTVSISAPNTSGDLQTREGSDSWIGHVYRRSDTGNSPADGVAFANYYGTITENETFNETFGGGGDVTCFPVSASESSRSVQTRYFSVRYRMKSSKSGIYLADLGSDDGSRLIIDGVKVYDRWVDRAMTTDPKVLFQLNGTSSLLFDFYESGGGNQVAFQNFLKVPNNLTTGINQSICQGGTLTAINANNSFTDAPISSTSGFTMTYQWQQAGDLAGPWSDIPTATAINYTPTVSSLGTYYFRRKLTVSKTNLGMSSATIATDYSNVATITISASANIPTFNQLGPYCLGEAPGILPTTSSNSITGTWSPSSISTASAGTTVYTFTPTSGQCATNTTMSVVVNENMTASAASSTPTLCINNLLTNITHTTTGATGIGSATGLPAGVTVGWSGGTITISGTPTAAGTFNYSIPLTGGCGSANATGTISALPLTHTNTITPEP